MKSSIFRLAIFLIALLSLSLPMSAEEGADSADMENSRYLMRLKKREERWLRLIPNITAVQYAGSIGTVSIGMGWDYGKGDSWETQLLLGVLPKRYNRNTYWTLTLKEIYVPWKINLSEVISVKPFYATLFVNSILHSDFWTSEPDRYPQGYYGFSSRVRFHAGIGQRFSLNIPQRKRVLGKELSLYYEVSTCDLYVRQKALNGSIPFKDILSIGIGLIYRI